MAIKTLTSTVFRNNLKKYFNEVCDDNKIIIVPRSSTSDKSGVVIISLEEFNSLKETEYLLSSKENSKRIEESISQLEGGNSKEINIKLNELKSD